MVNPVASLAVPTVDRAGRPDTVLNIDQLMDRLSDKTVWIREPPTGTYRRLLPMIAEILSFDLIASN